VSSACRGRIVWVELLDPKGRNPKRRPAVIVTPNEEIRPGGQVWVVAISTQLDAVPAGDMVELPWQRGGHPRTGLRERSAAICSWRVLISLDAIQEFAGIIPGRQMIDLLARIGPLPAVPLPAAESTDVEG
jgi:mRNA-degrading endonuclease toxin of MazEF toxin-antitoxin module